MRWPARNKRLKRSGAAVLLQLRGGGGGGTGPYRSRAEAGWTDRLQLGGPQNAGFTTTTPPPGDRQSGPFIDSDCVNHNKSQDAIR